MKACATYFGSDLSATEVRHCRPISPMREPSRARTSEDCGGCTSFQASSEGGCCSWAPSEAPRGSAARSKAVCNSAREGKLRERNGSAFVEFGRDTFDHQIGYGAGNDAGLVRCVR